MPSDDAPEEEKNTYYQAIANEKIVKMIEKANEKNPEGETLTDENWGKLPVTLRYNVMSDILSVGREDSANFPSG